VKIQPISFQDILKLKLNDELICQIVKFNDELRY
jgi:hypothetical protein